MREESSPGLRLPRTFTSLRHPNYRLYFLGQLGSLIGFWMQHAAQSWLICELIGSKAMLGIAGLVANAPIPLLSIVGGHLADRYPKRRILGPAVAGGGPSPCGVQGPGRGLRSGQGRDAGSRGLRTDLGGRLLLRGPPVRVSLTPRLHRLGTFTAQPGQWGP